MREMLCFPYLETTYLNSSYACSETFEGVSWLVARNSLRLRKMSIYVLGAFFLFRSVELIPIANDKKLPQKVHSFEN
jgi:hypothetical protein